MLRSVLLISSLQYGGAQRQVVELANHMDARRFDLHVCSLSHYVPLASELLDRERRLHIVAKRFTLDVTVVPRLVRLLRGLKADVVHSFLFDADIAARLAGRLARIPLVVGSERNTDYHLKPRQLLAYWLTRQCVDLIIANSHAGAVFNSRRLGHPPSLYRVIHNGVNTEHFSPRDGRTVRHALGITPEERVVGMFASFKHQKNHPLFFAAATHVLHRFPRTRLLLVGDELYGGMHGSNAYKRRIYRLIDELGIQDQCLFIGNRPDVARFYCACDVTVVPSLFEGTANALLESMACAVPVIATDVSDNPHVVPDGHVGYIVPLGDEWALADRICRLLGDDDLRTQMGNRGRAWVAQEFSMSRLVEKTAATYLEALNRKRGTG